METILLSLEMVTIATYSVSGQFELYHRLQLVGGSGKDLIDAGNGGDEKINGRVSLYRLSQILNIC